VQTGVNPGLVTYTYDDDGVRIGKTAGGLTTRFLLDKNRNHAQAVVETTGSTIVTYNYGNGLISRSVTGTGSNFYLADGLFSTRQLTTSAGLVTDTYTYDGFGALLASTGTTLNNYRFTGEQFDPNVGLYYLRARYYDQATGRFSAIDPLEGSIFAPQSLHRYLYANANPVNNMDPSGRFAVPAAVAAIIGFIVLYGEVLGILAGLADVTGEARLTAQETANGRTDSFILRICDSLQGNYGYGIGAPDAVIAEDPKTVKNPYAMKYSTFIHGASPGLGVAWDLGSGPISFNTNEIDPTTKKVVRPHKRRLTDFVGTGTYSVGAGLTLGLVGGTLHGSMVLAEGTYVNLGSSLSPKFGLGIEVASIQQVDWTEKDRGPSNAYVSAGVVFCDRRK
jgi:RHS repeat-associated protein